MRKIFFQIHLRVLISRLQDAMPQIFAATFLLLLAFLIAIAAIAEAEQIADCKASGGTPEYETELMFIHNGQSTQVIPIEVYRGCQQ